MKLGEDLSPEEMDKVLEEQGRLQDRIDAVNALGHRLAARARDGRAAAVRRPMPTSRRSRAASAAAWRSAGCCSSRPICCCSTSRPTTSTPSRWRGSSASSRNTRAPSWRSRTIATSSTTSPSGSSSSIAAHGIPWKGNYSSWLDQKQQRLAQEEKSETQAAEDAAARARVDPHVAARAPGQGQGASERLRAAAQRGHGAEDRAGRDLHSARPSPRRPRRRGARAAEGVRRPAAHRRSELHAAARRHRRRDRTERRRQDDAVPDDHRSGEAGRRHAAARRDRAGSATSIRAATRWRRTRACGRRSPAAKTS